MSVGGGGALGSLASCTRQGKISAGTSQEGRAKSLQACGRASRGPEGPQWDVPVSWVRQRKIPECTPLDWHVAGNLLWDRTTIAHSIHCTAGQGKVPAYAYDWAKPRPSRQARGRASWATRGPSWGVPARDVLRVVQVVGLRSERVRILQRVVVVD